VIPALNWPSAEIPGTIAANEVHLWAWTLNPAPPDPSPHVALLDSQELQRMHKFYFTRDRARYAANHANLRRILGAYLNQLPERVKLRADPLGKPELAFEDPIAFNLSHSRTIAVLAVAHGQPVGVDVEDVRPIEPEVAARFFSAAELAALSPLQGEAWVTGFYRCWTRKEAILKAEGVGLYRALDSFDVSLRADEPAELLASRAAFRYPWKLHHLSPAAGIVGALATALPEVRLACFSFLADSFD
jgi:4'-phosphopantetheinyl transferase